MKTLNITQDVNTFIPNGKNSIFNSIFERRHILKILLFLVVMLSRIGVRAQDANADTVWTVRYLDGWVTSVKFSQTGDSIIHTQGFNLNIRDLKGKLLKSIPCGQQYGMVLTPDYKYAITYNIPYSRKWDLSTGLEVMSYEMKKDSMFSTFNFYRGTIDISNDGNFIGATSDVYFPNSNMDGTGKFYIWDAQTGNIFFTDTVETRLIKFSPNNKDFCVAEEQLRLPAKWSLTQKKKIGIFTGAKHQSPIQYITISPDSKYMITTSGENAMLWDYQNMTFIRELKFGSTCPVLFANKPGYLIWGGGGIGIYDLKNDSIIYNESFWNKGFGVSNSIAQSNNSEYIIDGHQNDLLLFKSSLLPVEEKIQTTTLSTLKPNPASKNLVIQNLPNTNLPFRILISDIKGNERLKYQNLFSINNTITISVSELPTGEYFLVLISDNFKQAYKLIKE